ncbi:MAG: HNH endonuclease signature motif containing protein [Corynebacterium sp.]|uniref:HNH endonuclease signature motif containing protein n=1 Tax=Corynebacterium sp. TaxID=1720 RepID=UPI0026DF4A11|nr:HNH endonuclease signature motif containing protein [Corynebacterium sp.]MDO5670362.1 HNH endonuclease signature motif containing protein [Corynebacterium sp.]
MDTIDYTTLTAVELEVAKLLWPKKYYAVSSPFERESVAGRRLRKADHELWQSLLPAVEDDYQMVIANLKRLMGKGEGYLSSAVYAHLRLNEMPRLKALQEKMFHLDLERLKAIDAVMSKADVSDAEVLRVIDTELSEYLTPTRANQLLPSTNDIRKKLNAIIQSLDDSISTNDKPPREESFDVSIREDEAFINVALDPVDAKEIDMRVRKYAKKHKISEVEAFKALVRGEGSTDITLNIYQAHDVEGAPGWVPGVGYIPAEQADDLAAKATTVRDMDDLYDKVADKYETPDDIRAVVVGWDGTCSEPYCDCREERTQMDHRIDYKEGGQTTASNLSAKCPTHHNVKTDGRSFYLIDPHTRDKYILYEDGRWVVVEAKGPLTPKERHWVQTVGQRTKNRRERIRAESQAKREEERQAQPPPPPDDEPPPF